MNTRKPEALAGLRDLLKGLDARTPQSIAQAIERARAVLAKVDTTLGRVPDDFYTAPQCAAYLKLSHDKLYKWRTKGGSPPFIQLAVNRFLYRKTDVDEWLVKQRKLSILPKPRRGRGGGGGRKVI